VRLIRHLNEQTPQKGLLESFLDDQLIELIHKECKPWLSEIDDFNITTVVNPVFRGVNQSIGLYRIMKGTRASDRTPKLTQKEVFEIFDKAFADRFGWWVRSKGVFTGSERVAYSYGSNQYVFMPMGKYRYVWSTKYSKVWHNLTTPENWKMMTDKERKIHLDDQEQVAKMAVRYYKDRNIRGVMRTDNVKFEAIFECKNYLLIDKDIYIDISDRI
jgi:hypothetical protein